MNTKNRNQQTKHSPQPAVAHQAKTTSWAGPLPPPEALEKFNFIVPNGAERIIRMAELEQSHRLETESAITKSNILSQQRALDATILGSQGAAKLSVVSLVMGFSVCILAIGAAVWTALAGCPWQIPVALVGVPLSGAVIAFINRREKSKDNSSS